jgi:hypothetical protein
VPTDPGGVGGGQARGRGHIVGRRGPHIEVQDIMHFKDIMHDVICMLLIYSTSAKLHAYMQRCLQACLFMSMQIKFTDAYLHTPPQSGITGREGENQRITFKADYICEFESIF